MRELFSKSWQVSNSDMDNAVGQATLGKRNNKMAVLNVSNFEQYAPISCPCDIVDNIPL
jgi:hypothetical protein